MMASSSCWFNYCCRTARVCIGQRSPLTFLSANSLFPLIPRHSTSAARLRELRIEDESKARKIVAKLLPEERRRLLFAIDEITGEQPIVDSGKLTRKEMKQLFVINTLPFIGFGFLDNMVMIIAGEYIDQTLGAWLAISTMAAAALGNLISDVAGVGFSHYVEFAVSKFGIKHPVLTSEQLESGLARTIVNLGRAFGLIIGCLVGMFPLLFFDAPPSR